MWRYHEAKLFFRDYVMFGDEFNKLLFYEWKKDGWVGRIFDIWVLDVWKDLAESDDMAKIFYVNNSKYLI